MRLEGAGLTVLMAGIGGVLGCGTLLDIPDDPVLVAEDDIWFCIEEPQMSEVPATTMAVVRVSTCNFVTNCATPVTGVSVNVCSKRDVGCNSPLQSGVMDRDGLIEVEVPTAGGFDGYLQVTSAPALCTDLGGSEQEVAGLCGLLPECDVSEPDERCYLPKMAPAMLFLNPPVFADILDPIVLPLIPTAELPRIVDAAGAQLDPTAGNLFVTAQDCAGEAASGVTYTISQDADVVTPLYVDQGVVSDTAFQTDRSGIGGFVGVPPGFAEVTGYAADGRRIGKIGVQSAPFTLTYSALVVTP